MRLKGIIVALAIAVIVADTAPTASATLGPATAAAIQPLLAHAQSAQQTLFTAFDAGVEHAFGQPRRPARAHADGRALAKATDAFLQGERTFLSSSQTAAAALLGSIGGSTSASGGEVLSRAIAHAGRGWLTRDGDFAKWAPRSHAAIEDTVQAQTAFWKAVGAAVSAFAASASNPASFQQLIEGAARTFAGRFRHAVATLLDGSRTTRAQRTALLAQVDVGVGGFTRGVGVGVHDFLNIASAPASPLPPNPTPTPAPNPSPTPSPTPTPAPQHSEILLQCPANAHEGEPLKITGTLRPAVSGAPIELLYYRPPTAAIIEPAPIVEHVTVQASGNFSDESVTPAEERLPPGNLPLHGTWRIIAEYAGDATHTPAIPAQCETFVES